MFFFLLSRTAVTRIAITRRPPPTPAAIAMMMVVDNPDEGAGEGEGGVTSVPLTDVMP